MARKNSNVKLTELIDSEDTHNHREILSVLFILLSIRVNLDDNKLSPTELEIKKILTDPATQMQLGKIGSTFLIKFVNNEGTLQRRTSLNNVVTKSQKILEIMNRIIDLLDTKVLVKTWEPHSVSRQLRSFLLSQTSSDCSGEFKNPNDSDPNFDMYTNCSIAEERYYLSILNIINNLVHKDTSNKDVKERDINSCNYFCIPMIREGILDTINDMHKYCKDDKLLPSFDYIKSQIDFPEFMKIGDEQSNTENPFTTTNKTPKQKIKENIKNIKAVLELADYQGEYLTELKGISSTLKNRQFDKKACTEAIKCLASLISKHGMTYYEATESEIVESLHSFLLQMKDSDEGQEPLWTRISIFIKQFAGDQKCIKTLTQVLHSLINTNEMVEELHTSNNKNHSFFVRGRFSDHEQVKIICEYQSLFKKEDTLMDNFFRQMEEYEKEFEKAPPTLNVLESKDESEFKKIDKLYQDMGRFVILVPTNITLKRLAKTIQMHLKSRKNVKNLQSSRRGRPQHRFRGINDARNFFRRLGMNEEEAGRASGSHRFENINESDEEVPEQEVRSKKFDKRQSTINAKIKLVDIEDNMKVEDWIKDKQKNHRNHKAYLKIFEKQRSNPPNLINFTIEDPKLAEEMKEEGNEEMSIDESQPIRDKKRNPKQNRTYSLYLQKQQKSLQDRELERLIAKDILSKEAFIEEIGTGSMIFELLKFLFMLKESNFKNIFESSSKTSSPVSNFRLNAGVLHKQKFKSLFTNSKIDGLLRKYLLNKHHSD